ncbi:Thiol reductase thioredoxin [Fasciola hepatica]|uniref:Thioredoxin n=1 Tax=Fasciola hepatica TaxID=6192 RepID=A0A4E0R2C6_FASHE|nr:Thiol reductase thioredoxin [Fasciola hepatica]
MKEIITEDELQLALKESHKRLVVLDFFAEWCGPCKKAIPEFHKIGEDYPEVLCCKVNVDEVENAGEEYNITGMPTFIAFRNGQRIDEVVGGHTELVRKMIDKHK